MNNDMRNDMNLYKLPALGRRLLWLENAENRKRILYVLYAACAILIALDLFYKKKSYFDIEDLPGFYAIYGLVVCVVLVLISRVVQALLKRKQSYYAPKDVDAEEHPASDLGRETIDD